MDFSCTQSKSSRQVQIALRNYIDNNGTFAFTGTIQWISYNIDNNLKKKK